MIAERIRFEPALPRASSSSPSRRTTVGDIIDGIRRPAGVEWKPNGFRSSSPSMLLRWTPVPGTITPEPVPFEQVTLAQPPCASTAVMWVVEPSRSPGPPVELPRRQRSSPTSDTGARKSPRSPLVEAGRGSSVVRASCASLHRARRRCAAGRIAEAVEDREGEGDQDPARRRWRVGEDLAPEEAGPDRLAGDRLVRREVLGREASRRRPRPSRRSPSAISPW